MKLCSCASLTLTTVTWRQRLQTSGSCSRSIGALASTGESAVVARCPRTAHPLVRHFTELRVVDHPVAEIGCLPIAFPARLVARSRSIALVWLLGRLLSTWLSLFSGEAIFWTWQSLRAFARLSDATTRRLRGSDRDWPAAGDDAMVNAREMVEQWRAKGDKEGAYVRLPIVVAIGTLGEPPALH